MRLIGLCKTYGALEVLRDIDLEITGRRILCLLGPSGCGKTTLLNIICQTVAPDSGILEDLNRRVISYVFQEPRLLPWKTVRNNIAFVLEERLQKDRRNAVLDRILEAVELAEFEGYFPSQLSGGMKQRVSIARAFAYPSDLVLMDEPFRALDLKLKLQLAASLLSLWRENRRTVVFVTHDIMEAVLLGDEIVVLSERPGRIIEKLDNPIRKKDRSLENTDSLRLEKRLYNLLLS